VPPLPLAHVQMQRRAGVVIEIVPDTEDHDIDVAALERMITSGPLPKLVAISHIATNSGAPPPPLFPLP